MTDVLTEGLTLADISALMARAVTARSRMAEILATAKMEHERIDRWAAQETEHDARLVAEVEGQCVSYLASYLQRIDETGDTSAKRSVSTPYGRIKSLKHSPSPVISDPDQLREWAQAHGWMRPPAEPQVNWRDLKATGEIQDGAFLVNGEVVPGVEIEPTHTDLSVEWDK